MDYTTFVLDLYRLFNERHFEEYLSRLAPEVVWHEELDPPYGGTFVGRDAVWACVLQRIETEFDGFEIFPYMLEIVGDRVSVWSRFGGQHRETGRTLEAQGLHIYTVAGEHITEVRHLNDRALMDRFLRGAWAYPGAPAQAQGLRTPPAPPATERR